jgi:hypothetical protein
VRTFLLLLLIAVGGVYSVDINVTYPTNATSFGPGQCSFLTQTTTLFTNQSTSNNTSCYLYLNGGFLQLASNFTNAPNNSAFNFTGLTLAGNYSVSCVSSDSNTTAASASAYAYYSGMTSCAAKPATINTTTTQNTTKVYTQVTIPYFNIREVMFLLLVGMSLYGMFHFLTMDRSMVSEG